MIQIDMPTPKNCADCCFATADLVNGTITLFCMTPVGRKMYAPDLIGRKTRPEWCPLKEQEAKQVSISQTHCGMKYGLCPRCEKQIDMLVNPHYCGNCGQELKWE